MQGTMPWKGEFAWNDGFDLVAWKWWSFTSGLSQEEKYVVATSGNQSFLIWGAGAT